MGYVGNEDATEIIMEGLIKLEYRGYDSAGIAVYQDNGIQIIKRKGRLTELKSALDQANLYANVGIGHTRWATHGEPSMINSHPHLGQKKEIAVVHNGIIENYQQIKQLLESKGVEFSSDTDSEVVAQLAEYYYNGDILDTITKVTHVIEGSYALGIISSKEPHKLYAVKKDNPLIVGTNKNGSFIASDVPAILNHTRSIYYMEDKQIAVLEKDKIEFYTTDKEPIEKSPTTIDWDISMAEKGGYEHFMIKEIMEQPDILKNTILKYINNDGINFEHLPDINNYNKLSIVACGSSYNVGMVGKYILEDLTRIPTEVDLASEYRYKNPIVDEKTLVILISQSGETADTIAAMREAKRRGVTTVAIVNVKGSTIANEADYTIYTVAGPEIAVATTKAFSAQLFILTMMAITFAEKRNTITKEKAEELLSELKTIPEKAKYILTHNTDIQRYAADAINSKSIFFMGRNIDYAISMEGSLKLKEISYIHSEAYAGGELKHGTISLIEDGTIVIAISGCQRLFGKLWSNVEQVVSRGAVVILITNNENDLSNDKLHQINLSPTNELLSPLLSVLVVQLFSYYVAANKGCDIDKPRNLAKSVTVE